MVRIRISGCVDEKVYRNVLKFHRARLKKLRQDGNLSYDWRLARSSRDAAVQKKRKGAVIDPASFSASVEELLKRGVQQLAKERGSAARSMSLERVNQSPRGHGRKPPHPYVSESQDTSS